MLTQVGLEPAQAGAESADAAGQVRDQRIPLLGWHLGQHFSLERIHGTVARGQHAPPLGGKRDPQNPSMRAIRLPLDESVVLEVGDHLVHRLGCDVGAACELGVREAVTARYDGQCRVAGERKVVRAHELVDLTPQGAIQPGHDIAHSGLAGSRHAPSVPACPVSQPDITARWREAL